MGVCCWSEAAKNIDDPQKYSGGKTHHEYWEIWIFTIITHKMEKREQCGGKDYTTCCFGNFFPLKDESKYRSKSSDKDNTEHKFLIDPGPN